MFRTRSPIVQVVVVLAAFLVGTALGHWMTDVGQPAGPVAKVDPVALSKPKATPRPVSSENSGGAAEASAVAPTQKKSLTDILKERNSTERTKDLEEFARSLPSSEFGAALKQLHRMPESSARELALRLLTARWTETDPEGALQFAAQNHDFDYIASDVYQQFAADNFQGALARAQSIADPNMRYQALLGVLSYMADQDPLGALKLAGTLGSFPNNEPLSQAIYRQWSAIDPQAAAAQAALDPAGQGWRSPVSQVLRNWATQDPLAAIAWSNSVADATSQARDIGQVIRQWSRDDPTAAANWVNTVPTGNVRDSAAAALAFSLAGTDPSAALGWAESISDATQRDNAMQRLSREIMYRNPANGAAILQAAGVPQNLIPPPPNPNQGRGRGP